MCRCEYKMPAWNTTNDQGFLLIVCAAAGRRYITVITAYFHIPASQFEFTEGKPSERFLQPLIHLAWASELELSYLKKTLLYCGNPADVWTESLSRHLRWQRKALPWLCAARRAPCDLLSHTTKVESSTECRANFTEARFHLDLNLSANQRLITGQTSFKIYFC